MKKNEWAMLDRCLLIPLLIALAGAFLVAAIGGALTDTGPWFQALNKPSWQPPDSVFGPVWTILYALIAASAALGWKDAGTSAERKTLVWLFALNGILNVGWSLLFFHLQRPAWALAEIVILWLSIALLIAFLWRFSKRAAALLLPYQLREHAELCDRAAQFALNNPEWCATLQTVRHSRRYAALKLIRRSRSGRQSVRRIREQSRRAQAWCLIYKTVD